MLAREASCAVRNRSRLLNVLVAPGLVYPSISCRVSVHMNRIAARRALWGEFFQQCPQFLCNVGLSKEQPSHPALPLRSELSLRLRVLTTACRQKILASPVKFTSHGVSPLRGNLPPDGYDSVTCALPGIRGHERDDCCASSARKGCYLWIHQCPPALSGGFVAPQRDDKLPATGEDSPQSPCPVASERRHRPQFTPSASAGEIRCPWTSPSSVAEARWWVPWHTRRLIRWRTRHRGASSPCAGRRRLLRSTALAAWPRTVEVQRDIRVRGRSAHPPSWLTVVG